MLQYISHVLRNRGFFLIVLGVFLLLGSGGTITTQIIGYEPLPSNDGVRFVLVGVGGLLVLIGLAIVLQEQGVHDHILGSVYIGASALLLAGIGTLIALQPEAVPLQNARPIFLRWEANPRYFYAELDMEQLDQYAGTHRAALICRVSDPSVPVEEDQRIVTSRLYQIRDVDRQPIRVEFDKEFRERLAPGDHIECHLALIPARYQQSKLVSMGQVSRELDGVLPNRYVFDRVSDCGALPADPSSEGDAPG